MHCVRSLCRSLRFRIRAFVYRGGYIPIPIPIYSCIHVICIMCIMNMNEWLYIPYYITFKLGLMELMVNEWVIHNCWLNKLYLYSWSQYWKKWLIIIIIEWFLEKCHLIFFLLSFTRGSHALIYWRVKTTAKAFIKGNKTIESNAFPYPKCKWKQCPPKQNHLTQQPIAGGCVRVWFSAQHNSRIRRECGGGNDEDNGLGSRSLPGSPPPVYPTQSVLWP